MARSQASLNRDEGAIFEELFKKQAQRLAMLAEKNHLTAKYIGGPQRIILTKSKLDFTLITQDGRVGFFDCKIISSKHFTYSRIDKDQLTQSTLYNEFNVASGFICWFREENKMVFFKGQEIEAKGPGARFELTDGLLLGRFENFDLRLLFK